MKLSHAFDRLLSSGSIAVLHVDPTTNIIVISRDDQVFTTKLFSVEQQPSLIQ